MKKYLLSIFVIIALISTGFITYLVASTEATASISLNPDARHAICIKNWKNVRKDNAGDGMWVAGGYIGIRFLEKSEWIKSCMER